MTTAGGLIRYHYAVRPRRLPDEQGPLADEKTEMHTIDGRAFSAALKEKIANRMLLGVD
jgi:hypothetical protein